MSDKKRLVRACIEGSVSDLLYYDRKEDEDLKVGDIEAMLRNGSLEVAEVVQWFDLALIKGLRDE